jgi:hypothetical protein
MQLSSEVHMYGNYTKKVIKCGTLFTMPHYMKFSWQMMYTTTCHIIVEYNLEFAKNIYSLLQFVTSWSAPCTTHILILDKPQILWTFSTNQSKIKSSELN